MASLYKLLLLQCCCFNLEFSHFYDFQQSEVVALHTDLKVGKYYGEMGVDFWDEATWKQELDKYEVCLAYSFYIKHVCIKYS